MQTFIDEASVRPGGAIDEEALSRWLRFLFAQSSEEEEREGITTLLALKTIPTSRLEMNKWLFMDMSQGGNTLPTTTLQGLLLRWDPSLSNDALLMSLREAGASNEITLDAFQRWMAACFGDASALEYKEGVASLRCCIDHTCSQPSNAASQLDTAGSHRSPASARRDGQGEEEHVEDGSWAAVEKVRRQQLELALEEERLLLAAMAKNAKKRKQLARGLQPSAASGSMAIKETELKGESFIAGPSSNSMAPPALQPGLITKDSPLSTPQSRPGSRDKLASALEMLSFYESHGTPRSSLRPVPTPSSAPSSGSRHRTPRSVDRALAMLEDMERSTPRSGKCPGANPGPPASPVPFAEGAGRGAANVA